MQWYIVHFYHPATPPPPRKLKRCVKGFLTLFFLLHFHCFPFSIFHFSRTFPLVFSYSVHKLRKEGIDRKKDGVERQLETTFYIEPVCDITYRLKGKMYTTPWREREGEKREKERGRKRDTKGKRERKNLPPKLKSGRDVGC